MGCNQFGLLVERLGLIMANICCSIEMEPKTLNEGQLNIAREVGADVVQKMESKEATITLIKVSLIPLYCISYSTTCKIFIVSLTKLSCELLFFQGLESVREEQNYEQILKDENSQNKHVIEGSCSIINSNEKPPQVIERPCQCSLVTNINIAAESPDQINLKEPLSAPF
ncbi:hypothetical protein Dsin_013906 [Dipteronia sinensis]|uniref:Uncharacterized protein n=1 Tax=Dipteronia sinensis TaxID=43782 RepID=A0AAE0E9F5_9ROSI|nr:hypothetical protein Dsin_013906 [Dipteronia sinensis]